MLRFLKSLFCNHRYVISHITPLTRKGTMMAHLVCLDCSCTMDTFHDLTETEEIMFRHPEVEEQLIRQGFVEKKGNKLLLHTTPKQKKTTYYFTSGKRKK